LVCGSGFGSGSRTAKITHKSRKSEEISCFEVLDVLVGWLEADFPVDSKPFIDACE
jgi:hypothetical protein